MAKLLPQTKAMNKIKIEAIKQLSLLTRIHLMNPISTYSKNLKNLRP